MKIAVAQMDTREGDFSRTVAAMLAYGRRAAAEGCDLIVYPSVALLGARPQALLDNISYISDVSDAVEELAGGLEVPALVPFALNAQARQGADAVFMREGQVVPLSLAALVGASEGAPVDERMLLGIMHNGAPSLEGVDSEQLSLPPSFDLGDIEIGVAYTREDLAAFAEGRSTADVVCYFTQEGLCADDELTTMAPSLAGGCFVGEASDANAWVVGVAPVGAYGDAVYAGGSFVLAPWGELLAAAPSCAEDLLIAEFDVMSEGPLQDGRELPGLQRSSLVWDACTLYVRDHVSKRGYAGAALVVDGTLASCAAAAVATDALGPMRVSALVCAASDEAQASARECVRNLKIHEVDELSQRDLARAAACLGGDVDAGLAVRGLVATRLAAMAEQGGLLALSSVDKTALCVGAGAGVPAQVGPAGALAPFGDVFRSDVARMARLRNATSPVIPQAAFGLLALPKGLGLEELAGSDELRLSELDAALLLHVERGAVLAELAGERLGGSVAGPVIARVRSLAGARRGLPAFPRLSAHPLGAGEPDLTCAWADHELPETEGSASVQELFATLRAMADAASELRAGEGAADEDAGGEDAPDAAYDPFAEMLKTIQELTAGQAMGMPLGMGAQGGTPGEGEEAEGGMWPRGLISDN